MQHIERPFECKSGKYGIINTEPFHLNSPTLPTATALPGSSNELVHTFGWQATFKNCNFEWKARLQPLFVFRVSLIHLSLAHPEIEAINSSHTWTLSVLNEHSMKIPSRRSPVSAAGSSMWSSLWFENFNWKLTIKLTFYQWLRNNHLERRKKKDNSTFCTPVQLDSFKWLFP